MIKIIADSTCDLTNNEAQKLGVQIIPMKVLIDGEEYVSGKNLFAEEFYQKLETCKKLPQTSLITEFEYEEILSDALKKNEQVFVMCLSSKLSGSYENLQKACNEINSSKLEILDTQSVTFAYKALVVEAVKLSKICNDVKELKENMEILCTKVKLLAAVDNVKYLIKGGRLSLMKGIAVKALNIKPIVTLKDGKLDVVAKGIGTGNAIKNLIKQIQNIDKSKPIYFGHSNDLVKLNMLKKTCKQLGINSDDTSVVGPVIGTHAGPSCVGVVYFEK